MSHHLSWRFQESFHDHLHWKVARGWFQHGFLPDRVIKWGTNVAQTRGTWSFSDKIWWQDPMLTPTSSETSGTGKRRFPRNTSGTILTWSLSVDVEGRQGLRSLLTDYLPSSKHLKQVQHWVWLIQSSRHLMMMMMTALCTAHTVVLQRMLGKSVAMSL